MSEYLQKIIHTQFFSFLTIFLSLMTLVLILKVLQPESYGEYVLIQGFIAFGGLIFSQNLYLYTRLKIPGAIESVQYNYLKSTIVLICVFYLFVFFLLQLIGLFPLVWQITEISLQYAYYALVMLGLELINLELMRFLIAVNKIEVKNKSQFFQKVLMFVGLLFLIFINKIRLDYILYIFIISQIYVSIHLLTRLNLKKILTANFSKDIISQGYSLAIPLFPVGLVTVLFGYMDKLLISIYIGKAAVGQYGFAYQMVSILMLLIGTSITLTLFPYATKAHNNDDIRERTDYFMRMLKFGFILSLLAYILIMINGQMLIKILGLDQYSGSVDYLSILGFIPLFQIIYSVCSHHLQLLGEIRVQLRISLLTIPLSVSLNYILVHLAGAWGVALSVLLSYVLLSIFFLLMSMNKDKNFSLSLRTSVSIRYIIITISIAAIVFVLKWLGVYNNWVVVISLNIVLVFLSILGWVKFGRHLYY